MALFLENIVGVLNSAITAYIGCVVRYLLSSSATALEAYFAQIN